jgi:hypothetical protein
MNQLKDNEINALKESIDQLKISKQQLSVQLVNSDTKYLKLESELQKALATISSTGSPSAIVIKHETVTDRILKKENLYEESDRLDERRVSSLFNLNKLPKLKGDSQDEIARWIFQIRAIIDGIIEMSEKRKLLLLPPCLSNSHLTTLESYLDTQGPWSVKEFFTQLLQTAPIRNNMHKSYYELHLIRQGNDFVSYVKNFKAKELKLRRERLDWQESLSLSAFNFTLQDRIRAEVEFRNPTSLNQAIEFATTIFYSLRSMSQFRSPGSSSNHNYNRDLKYNNSNRNNNNNNNNKKDNNSSFQRRNNNFGNNNNKYNNNQKNRYDNNNYKNNI